MHGAIYAPGLSWQTLYVFEFIKSTLFYCLWLGRVYGVLSILRSREQSAQLVVVQAALAEAQIARLGADKAEKSRAFFR